MPWFWPSAPPCLRRSVAAVLVSDDETALIGVLWQVKGRWLVLRNAAVKKGKADPMPADGGELIVDRANVAYLQVID